MITDTQSTAVGDLLNQQLTVSLGTIDGANDDRSDVTSESCDADTEGTVTYQYPFAGTTVDTGSAVVILVCTDNPLITVANVTGETERIAILVLTEQGMVPSSVPVGNCPTAEEGEVISQVPDSGTATAGSPVTLGVCDAGTRQSPEMRLWPALS